MCDEMVHRLFQARSQVGKRGGSKIINVDLKWAWITKRGWVWEGDVPRPREARKLLKTLILQLNANQFADTCTSTLIPNLTPPDLVLQYSFLHELKSYFGYS